MFTIYLTPPLRQLCNMQHKTKVQVVLCCVYCVADAMGGLYVYCKPSLTDLRMRIWDT